MLRQRHLGLLDLGVPALLPFNRDPARVAGCRPATPSIAGTGTSPSPSSTSCQPSGRCGARRASLTCASRIRRPGWPATSAGLSPIRYGWWLSQTAPTGPADAGIDHREQLGNHGGRRESVVGLDADSDAEPLRAPGPRSPAPGRPTASGPGAGPRSWVVGGQLAAEDAHQRRDSQSLASSRNAAQLGSGSSPVSRIELSTATIGRPPWATVRLTWARAAACIDGSISSPSISRSSTP